MTKVTDALLKTMELARTKNDEYATFFNEAVVQRHYKTARELLKNPEPLLEGLAFSPSRNSGEEDERIKEEEEEGPLLEGSGP